jgi:hypothetical protein
MIPDFFYGSGMYRKHPNQTNVRNRNNSANNWAVVYFIVIKQNPLHNGNSPITDPITKIGVAHAFEQYIDFL